MVINELVEVLYFRNIHELINKINEISTLYYPHNPEKYQQAVDEYFLETLKSKENLLDRINDYAQHGKPIWQGQDAQYCDQMTYDKLQTTFCNNSVQKGKKVVELYERMKQKWAVHLDEYASRVNERDESTILELATGAGLGTCAVMKGLQLGSKMISIDIDLAAAKNADALAKYLGVESRAYGMNANFWCLPFENELFDVVCTHYGMDESGELPTTLSQIERVLKKSGKFVGVCRKTAYDRHRKFFELFNVGEEEARTLLNKARLCSGFENLVERAKDHNLKLEYTKEFTPDGSHKRVLFSFIKH